MTGARREAQIISIREPQKENAKEVEETKIKIEPKENDTNEVKKEEPVQT